LWVFIIFRTAKKQNHSTAKERNKMSLLLQGTEPEIKIPCVANNMENGKLKPLKFTAVFNRLDRAQAKELRKTIQKALEETRSLGREYASLEDADDTRKEEIEARIDEIENQSEDMISQHLKGWDLKGPSGKVDFNDENLAEVFRWTAYFDALYEGLFKATGTQREQQKQKN
jgi:hypothetical protein